jgi:broad specificity phosphatase PhoE
MHLLRLLPAVAALLALAAALAPAAYAAAQQAPAATTIVIVRHAEKGDGGDPRDPSLSAAGQARAAALAAALDAAEVSAVYATQYKRTRETGEPLAKRFKVEVFVRPVTADNAAKYADQVVKEILGKHAGKTVVVVGHSNTVIDFIEALGGRAPAPLEENDYDRLFIVVRPASGPARLIQARYGAPDPR